MSSMCLGLFATGLSFYIRNHGLIGRITLMTAELISRQPGHTRLVRGIKLRITIYYHHGCYKRLIYLIPGF
jgi:hypothetical protein